MLYYIYAIAMSTLVRKEVEAAFIKVRWSYLARGERCSRPPDGRLPPGIEDGS